MKKYFTLLLLVFIPFSLNAAMDRPTAIKRLNEINSHGKLSEIKNCVIQYKSKSGFTEIVDFTRPIEKAVYFVPKESANGPMTMVYLKYVFKDKKAVKTIDELGTRYSDTFKHMVGIQMSMLPKDSPFNEKEFGNMLLSAQAWQRIVYWCTPDYFKYIDETEYNLAY